jgi:hypothetical protein
MKHLLLLLLLALGLLGSHGSGGHKAIGFGPGVARMEPASPSSLRFSTASNREFARHDVQVLLRIVVLPSSARPVMQAPQGAPRWLRNRLAKPGIAPGTATAHRLWIVPEPIEQVVRYVQAHARPRPRPLVPFRSKTNGVAFHATGMYEFPPTPGRSTSRWLYVAMVPLPGRATAVFAQAGDQWLHLSPHSAVLTEKVKRIDIASRYGAGRPNVLVHVRDAFEVARIVADVNGLGVATPEPVCLLERVGGPSVTLLFRSSTGRLLARGLVFDPLGSGYSGPCNPLRLTIGSRTAPPLIGADLLRRIQQDLLVDLAPIEPSVVEGCLRRAGFETKTAGHALTARRNGSRWTISFHATGKVTTSRTPTLVIARCLRNPHVGVYG